MGKIKKLLKVENLLALFIVMCPILDIASFLYRNKFNTNYSISTFIRPIIPMIVFTYVFLKRKKQSKNHWNSWDLCCLCIDTLDNLQKFD